MFALAVIDVQGGGSLARDRLGEKPFITVE
jgi:hypothetical protein